MNHLTHDTVKQDLLQLSDTIFTGFYPRKPRHTCKATLVVYGESNRLKKIYYTRKLWRDRRKIDRETGEILSGENRCLACFYDQIFRLTKQVETEINYDMNSDWCFWEISKTDLPTFARKHARHYEKGVYDKPLKYLAIPITNKDLMVFANYNYSNSTPIPRVIPELFGLIEEYVLEMGSDERVRRSRGFGKEYKGNKGDGRQMKPQDDLVLIFYNEEHVKKVFEKHKIESVNGTLNKSDFDFVMTLLEERVEFYPIRDVNGVMDMINRVFALADVVIGDEKQEKRINRTTRRKVFDRD